MNWLVSVALHNFVGTIQSLVQSQIGKKYKNSAVATNAFAFTGLALFALVFSLFRMDSLQVHKALGFLLFFILGAVAFALQKIGAQKIYENLHAGAATVLTTLNICIAVVLSTVFLGEGLSMVQLIGLTLMLISLYVSLNSESKVTNKSKVVSSAVLAVISSMMFGIGFASERYLLKNLNAETYILFGWPIQASVVLMLYRGQKTHFHQTARFKKLASIYALLFVISGLFFVISMKTTSNASLVAALSNIKVILVSISAVFILKETRRVKKQIYSSIGVVIAIFLLLH